MTQAELIQGIRKIARGKGELITEDTKILEGGYFDSLSTTELILAIEEWLGHEIDVDDLDLENFQTPKIIYEKYFSKFS